MSTATAVLPVMAPHHTSSKAPAGSSKASVSSASPLPHFFVEILTMDHTGYKRCNGQYIKAVGTRLNGTLRSANDERPLAQRSLDTKPDRLALGEQSVETLRRDVQLRAGASQPRGPETGHTDADGGSGAQ